MARRRREVATVSAGAGLDTARAAALWRQVARPGWRLDFAAAGADRVAAARLRRLVGAVRAGLPVAEGVLVDDGRAVLEREVSCDDSEHVD